jgi:hypothetical protein
MKERCNGFMQRGEIEYRCRRYKGHVGSHRIVISWTHDYSDDVVGEDRS